jgi:predicted O-methyltransferase YrrM
MEFTQIEQLVRGVPFIRPANARYLYDLIVRERCSQILELGIAHGTATCYMAAAVQQLGGGKVVAVDLQEVSYSPSAEEQVARCGFGEVVEIHRMKSGYNWFLHEAIREQTVDDVCRPRFDLCVIDGPKNWTIDSSAFFLADKLLKPGGWMIFDDYSWTYAKVDSKRDATDGITHRSLSEEERSIPHVREIFELLVKQHPDYGRLEIREDSDWAVAQKSMSAVKEYRVKYDESVQQALVRLLRAGRRRLAGR